MNIRRAKKEDIPQIEELLYQVHKVHSDGRPDLFKAGEKKYTTKELEALVQNDEKPIFVAEDDVILGYAFCVFQYHGNSMYNKTTLYIDDLCVSEKNQEVIRSAQKLYEFVLDFAKKSNCYNVTLNVWACNESAKSFYERCGLSIQKYGMEKIL